MTGSSAMDYDAHGHLVTGGMGIEIFENGSPVGLHPGRGLGQGGTVDCHSGVTYIIMGTGGVYAMDGVTYTPRRCSYVPNLGSVGGVRRGRVAPGGACAAVVGAGYTAIIDMAGVGPINSAYTADGAQMARLGRQGRWLATSYHGRFSDPGVRLWETSSTGPPVSIESHPYCVFRRSDRPVLWEGINNTSATWTRSPEALVPLPFSAQYFGDIDFTPDGRLAVQANADGTMEVFDLSRMEKIAELVDLPKPVGSTHVNINIDVAGDGRHLAAATVDGWAAIWDLDNFTLVAGPRQVAQVMVFGHRRDGPAPCNHR